MTETARLALAPLLTLASDPDVPPSLLGEAALHWAAATDDTGWSAARVAPPNLLALLGMAEDPLDRLWAEPERPLWAARLAMQVGRAGRAHALAAAIPDGTPDERAWRDLTLDPNTKVSGECSPHVRLAGALAIGDLGEAAHIAEHVIDAGHRAIARARVSALTLVDADAVLAELTGAGFLVREATHELRMAMARNAFGVGDLDIAAGHATEALRLDPNGAATRLLIAEISAANADTPAAGRHFHVAARHGAGERDRALAGLVALGGAGSVGAAADLSVEHGDSATPRSLERYRPFIDLTMPRGLAEQDIPPVAIHTPLMSRDAVLQRREPWFAEIHPQRATAKMFRAELVATARLHDHPMAADYPDWLAAHCPAGLRATLTGAADLPMLDRALVSRLLSALGFYPDAKAILPDPRTPATDPESAYALASWLFAEQMYTTGQDVDLEPLFRRLDEQLGDDIRYARMKVVTTINATVNAARRQEADTIARWRAKGETALAAYTALAEVDGFNAALMTSRWYRAMGFLPFLTGDRDMLIADMDRWLGIAADLTGHDEHTRIIAADNYFPAVETAIRTHTYLGHHDTALALAEQLAATIDPVDPKTWLTAGELRHRAGDVTGALAAYERAAVLEFPYGRLSWFNAGQCHEQLGHIDEAVECYRRSLALWPTGLTPVRRLRDLHESGKLDDPVVIAWARRQPAWPTLPPYPGS